MHNVFSDGILVIHFIWILFIIAGLPVALIIRSPALRLFHTISLVFTIGMQAAGAYCPLTILEEYLRKNNASEFTYGGSFIITWLGKIIYIENLGVSLTIIYFFTALYLAIVLLSYLVFPLSGAKRK